MELSNTLISDLPSKPQSHPSHLSQDPDASNRHIALPHRDIPISTNSYTCDDQTQPNYIPPARKMVPISQMIEEDRQKGDDYIGKKYRRSKLDQLYEALYIPFLLAALFFLFSLPKITDLLLSLLPNAGIHTPEGALNTYGLLLKSALFGAAYYIIREFTQVFEE